MNPPGSGTVHSLQEHRRRHPRGEKTSDQLSVECIMDMGDRAVRMFADPARPPRKLTAMSAGRRWLWIKRFYAGYYLQKIRRGATRSPRWVW